jgi:hypothetical protein
MHGEERYLQSADSCTSWLGRVAKPVTVTAAAIAVTAAVVLGLKSLALL